MNWRMTGVLLLSAAAVACQDLATVNTTAPDEERALAQPGDVESLIGSAFKVWFDNTQPAYAGWGFSVAADEGSSSWGNNGMRDLGSEPRIAFPNSTGYSYINFLNTPWYGTYRAISSVNDGLRAVKGGMKFGTNGADTKRAEAFAKFVQGAAHGWLALQFDQAFIYTENDDLQTTDFKMVPAKDVMAAAIKMLDDAAALASGNTFTLPNTWVNGAALTNVELARVAKSYSARYLAGSARTPQERAAVNWNDVLTRINAGIQKDFGPTLDNTNWFDNYKNYTQRFDWFRADYKLVGPSDQSGNYQKWLSTAVADRLPFEITTPDRRITGATPTSDGTDFYYRATQNFPQDRGTYHWSNYGHKRYLTLRQTNIGFDPIMTVTEMDLLKAEAYIRLNQAAQAVSLINKTRTTRGQLPPVTPAGVTDAPDCVPRTPSGSCGSLMDALMYEKRIETFAVAAGLPFFDARGWGTLVPGTPIHFPVPARELETLGMVAYSFGGVNGSGSAK